MHLGDVRRLIATISVLGGAMLVWLLLLGLHEQGVYETESSATALEWLSLESWLWLGAVLATAGIAVVAALLYLVNQAPAGYARGIARQVQCDCKAVFMIHDTGHRPITHRCPNCQSLGVYDGTAPAVGAPPKPTPPARIIEVRLGCQTCGHRFPVTDTGARPLNVRCPKCRARGQLR